MSLSPTTTTFAATTKTTITLIPIVDETASNYILPFTCFTGTWTPPRSTCTTRRGAVDMSSSNNNNRNASGSNEEKKDFSRIAPELQMRYRNGAVPAGVMTREEIEAMLESKKGKDEKAEVKGRMDSLAEGAGGNAMEGKGVYSEGEGYVTASECMPAAEKSCAVEVKGNVWDIKVVDFGAYGGVKSYTIDGFVPNKVRLDENVVMMDDKYGCKRARTGWFGKR